MSILANIVSSGFASKIIEITAGESKTKLYAHAAYLCKSEKMKALIEGDWKDKETVVLSDWDEDTVKRLLEWLYLDSYSSPPPRTLATVDKGATPTDSTKASVEGHDRHSGDGHPLSLSVTTSHDPSAEIAAFLNKSKTIRSFDDLLQIHQAPLAPRVSCIDCFSRWKKAVSTLPSFDKFKVNYGPTLMAHARLYALANYMMLPGLKHLALEHLQDCLLYLGELPSECPVLKDLASLVRYVYDNTHATAKSEEPLRFFLTSYISLNFVTWRGVEVDRLMEEGGDFAIDIARTLSRGLEVLETEGLKRTLPVETQPPAKKAKKQRHQSVHWW